MASAQVRGTFSALYDGVDKTVYAVFGDQLKELDPEWKSLYTTKSSDKKFERFQTVTPLGDTPEKPEGEPYAFDSIKPGWSVDVTPVEFGLGFEVTETALEDDQYDQLIRATEYLAFSARYVQSKYAARPFNNGFTSFNSPDGVTLFSTAHVLKGGGTAANRPATDADLSHNALRDAIIDMGKNLKLESGQLMTPPQSLILYVPYDLEFLAHQIVNSTLKSDTADNATNALKRRRIEIVVGPQLTDTDAWFLLSANKRQHGLIHLDRVPVQMKPRVEDPYTGNRIYKARFRNAYGCWMWQNVYGTTGA